MNPPKSKSAPAPETGGLTPIPAATMVSFLEGMQRVLLNESPADGDIALTEHLDRKKLDFSPDSLHEIDRYLSSVHEHAEDVSGLPLLSTIWTIAMYVGEVIRRQAHSKHYAWVSVGEASGLSGETTIAYPDLGAVRALRAKDGDMCMPSRIVLRIILRGAKARTVYSFAQAAMGPADIPTQSGSPHENTP